jgi:8-oxo-dGTP pyrophosphatase MutT (NUDIX family)
MSEPAVVRAAGGVVLRPGATSDDVLVVYRSRYADWTLPKGKCEPGEADEACALREVREETGLECELLDELPTTEYRDSAGRPKHVRWWAMRVLAGETRTAPPEIDEVRWVPVSSVAAVLTHVRDVELVAAAVDPPEPV